jgi:hypothetical protein
MTQPIPEPTNVGPITGGNLRASDADRDQVATLLSAAYAEGRLSQEEHDERLDQLMVAKTFDDLLPITHDLVLVGPPVTVATPQTSSRFAIDTVGQNSESDNMIAVFGGVTRKGRWRIRKNTRALALFGGMDLDLRDAIFEAPVVEISGFWCFGGLDIKVPEGIEVQDQIAGIFGGSEVRDIGEPASGAPKVVIKGVALFGGVSVKGPKKRR